MAKKYRIPKSFQMGGQTIKVTVHNGSSPPPSDILGLCKFLENTIDIYTKCQGRIIAVEQVEQTFWHEYAHYLLFQTRKDELTHDEELVDLLGEFLYQSIGKKL